MIVERIDAGICPHLLLLVGSYVQLSEAVWRKCSNFAAEFENMNTDLTDKTD